MTFRLIKKYFTEPFKVQYVAQNESTGKELVVDFSIKHIQDWPELAVEEVSLIGARFQQIDSLLKKQKKISPKQSDEAFRINLHLNRLIGANGLVESDAINVWNSLSQVEKGEISRAFLTWNKEIQDKQVGKK